LGTMPASVRQANQPTAAVTIANPAARLHQDRLPRTRKSPSDLLEWRSSHLGRAASTAAGRARAHLPYQWFGAEVVGPVDCRCWCEAATMSTSTLLSRAAIPGHREPRERRGRQMPAPARRQGSRRAIQETSYSPEAGGADGTDAGTRTGGELPGCRCRSSIEERKRQCSARLWAASERVGRPSRFVGCRGE
jgi:hypothetical protein